MLKPQIKFFSGIAVIIVFYCASFVSLVICLHQPKFALIGVGIFGPSFFVAMALWSRYCFPDQNAQYRERRKTPFQIRLWMVFLLITFAAWSMASGPYFIITPVRERWPTGSTPTYATRIGPDATNQGCWWWVERTRLNPWQILPASAMITFVVWQYLKYIRQNIQAASVVSVPRDGSESSTESPPAAP